MPGLLVEIERVGDVVGTVADPDHGADFRRAGGEGAAARKQQDGKKGLREATQNNIEKAVHVELLFG